MKDIKKEVGKLLKLRRKQLGLTLKELSDNNICPATISNLERGISQKSEKLKYLMKKLGIHEHDFAKLYIIDKKERTKIQYTLETAESILNFYGPKTLKKAIDLEAIKLDTTDPYFLYWQYLLGKNLMELGKLKKAQSYFQKVVETDEDNQDNIIASSYNELGQIAEQENDLRHALDCYQTGAKYAQADDKRRHTYQTLLCNQARILLKLDRAIQANEIIQTLWYQQIDKSDTKAQMYYIKAKLLLTDKQYDEAIHLLNDGIEFARINNLVTIELRMWITLASIFNLQNKLDTAYQCFSTLMALEDYIDDDHKKYLVKSHIQLGQIYMKQSSWPQADAQFQKALKLAINSNDSLEIIEARIALSEFFLAQEQFNSAAASLEEAKNISKNNKYMEITHKILHLLANCYFMFDQDRYQKCLTERHLLQTKLEEEGGKHVHKDAVTEGT